MIDNKFFFDTLINNEVNTFYGVPDSLLKSICAYITENTDDSNHIIAANEGNALALGIGYHLATGRVPLIYMQNSGLGNIVNPLLSLADKEVYSIPLLLMIGWRGKPGIKDEPQHIKQGRITKELLNSMEIPFKVISDSTTEIEVEKIISDSLDYIRENNSQVAILVEKNTFSTYTLNKANNKIELMLREEAIKNVIDSMNSNSAIVATTGVASRELFEYRRELGDGFNKDFLTVGGMGHANQIALGIALSQPERNIFCFDGDGAMLMHMGSMPIIGSKSSQNFKHILFNNGCHDSVGGQPTICEDMDVVGIAEKMGYEMIYQATTRSEIKKSVIEMENNNKLSFLEIKVGSGFRKDLGRPTRSPLENKEDFMGFLDK